MNFGKSTAYIHLAALTACLLAGVPLHAQTPTGPNRYRIEFTDKNHSPFSISSPQHFLSERALQRRARHGVNVTQRDIPVSTHYLDTLKTLGIKVWNTSRWFNSATIQCTPAQLEKLNSIPFIRHTDPVLTADTATHSRFTFAEAAADSFKLQYEKAPSYYGRSATQTGMVSGHVLHQSGFRGKGMLIAVIDVGFPGTDELSGFDSLYLSGRYRGFKNFTADTLNPRGNHTHGTNVLSILAACLPDTIIGSAPEADYILLRSEEDRHEYIVEEDNWIAAVEYADSIGADIINSSLGYTLFTDTLQNHRRHELDGRTVRASRAATMAAARGMILCISAGNEADEDWRGISVPADADSTLAIGAVFTDGQRVHFSSVGPTADGRIKPDLMATGWATAFQDSSGQITLGMGTSYAAPVIAGFIACLWQARPDMKNMEIIELLKRSASHSSNPNPLYGYGIPDFSQTLQ